MVEYLYAFFRTDDKDVVAICPKDYWEKNHTLDGCSFGLDFEDLADDLELSEVEEGVFEWGDGKQMYDIQSALSKQMDQFVGSEELRVFCLQNCGTHVVEDAGAVSQATVPSPEPAPQPQPSQHQCSCPQPTTPRDCMRIQIGNHVIEIPMDVQTAMMLAQTFQAYAQYQIIVGQFQKGVAQPIGQVQQPTAPQQATQAALPPEKPKSVPTTPTTDTFRLSNSMRGEFLDVHGQTVVKIEQGGKLIAETKPCDTRDEAYDIATRFSRMIPGLNKPGEIIRK